MNLIFSMCRESTDGGPINSWDRIPYVTALGNGTPSVTPAVSVVHRNFIVADMGSSTTVDTDDGTSYWNVTENFSIFGGAKQDFGGHDTVQQGNLFVYCISH